jgi:hypothetical protein
MKTQRFGKSEAAALAAAAKFAPVKDALPIVVNSLPKSGTVLTRNILMGFYGTTATHPGTLGWREYGRSRSVFSDLCEPHHRFIIGHFPYHEISNDFIRSVPHPLRMIIVIRHPLDNCYSLARHYFRPGMPHEIAKVLRERQVSFEDAVGYCITGLSENGNQVQSVNTRFERFLTWRDQGIETLTITYESLVAAIRDLEAGADRVPFFETLFKFCGISAPADWRARVSAMSDPSLAWTYVPHQSEQERYPGRDRFLAMLDSLYPTLLDTTGYRSREAAPVHKASDPAGTESPRSVTANGSGAAVDRDRFAGGMDGEIAEDIDGESYGETPGDDRGTLTERPQAKVQSDAGMEHGHTAEAATATGLRHVARAVGNGAARAEISPGVEPQTGQSAPDLLFQEHRAIRRALLESIGRWEKVAVRGRWAVNSHAKSGTHLLRNLVLHFNSDLVHRQFLFYRNFSEILAANEGPRVYISHLPFFALSRGDTRIGDLNVVLLLRDPGAIALALARAFYDVNTTRADHLYLREHATFEEIVEKVVSGYSCEGSQFAPLAQSLRHVAADWRDRARFVLRFEEITAKLNGDDGALLEYFRPVLEGMFETVPDDAALRIRAAASPNISVTYSRTKDSPYDNIAPQDVYRLVQSPAGALLREVASELGYAVEAPARSVPPARPEPPPPNPKRNRKADRDRSASPRRRRGPDKDADWLGRMLRGRNGFQLRRFLIDLAGTSLIAADDAWLAALAAQSGKAGLPARFVRQDQVPQALAADSGVRRILVLDSANEEAARAQLLRRLREERPAGATDSYQVATFVADLLPVVIARRSADEVSFDPPPDISDTLLYSIVGTPRSGSTFLSDLLRSAGFGDPVEHLRAPLAAAFAARPPGLFDLARFTQRLIAAGRTGSVFGTKLLSGVGRGLEKSLTPPEAAFVRGLAARTTLIYLNRSDKVRQAISA